jgi:hypothetical protein
VEEGVSEEEEKGIAPFPITSSAPRKKKKAVAMTASFHQGRKPDVF